MTDPNAIPRAASLLLAAALAGGLTACDDATGPEGAGTEISLSVAVPGGSSASTATAPSFSVTQTDGQGNELTIDRLALVLAEIELEAENEECPEATGDTGDDDSDECEELDRGPLLVDFEPDSSAIEKNVTVADIPPRFTGQTFDEVEFEIEVPEEDDGQNPGDFLGPGVSVQVEGTYNDSSFTYTSNLEAEQELDENVSLEVMGSENPETNLTLMIDLRSWFRADDGSLIDPATAVEGGEFDEQVEDNISDSFDAFEDEDEDGVPDEDDDDDDGDDDDNG